METPNIRTQFDSQTTSLYGVAKSRAVLMFTVFAAVLTISGCKKDGPTITAATTVGVGLLEFEAAVRWDDVSKGWRTLRPAWVAKVQATTSPKDLASGLLALETNMGWKSVQPAWKRVRAGWVKALKSATTEATVAKRLVQLESHTKWSAVQEWWKKRRGSWLKKMGAKK